MSRLDEGEDLSWERNVLDKTDELLRLSKLATYL